MVRDVDAGQRTKLAGLLGLGLAVAVTLALVFALGRSPAEKASAGTSAGTVDFNMSATGCSSTGSPTSKCAVTVGSDIHVTVNLATEPAGGWAGYDIEVTYAAPVSYVDGVDPNPGDKDYVTLNQGLWPFCAFATGEGGFTPGDAKFACANGDGVDAMYTGPLASLDFTCKSEGAATLTLVAGNGATDVSSAIGISFEAQDEALTINCNPPPTPVPATPTPTPPPQPRVQKLPVIQNVFLTRQGAKIPPATCASGTDVADLEEKINIQITSADPKDPTVFQKLGAFQFEARFDDKLVCVSVEAGPAWASNAQVACSTLSDYGILRFGCVSVGKNAGLNGPGVLAILHVRPMEELYSQLRPNQDNGIPVQILNQGCKLADEQGHVIPIFSCEDADITFRFLEGDVDGPDCSVDVLDMQNVAFRWGAAKGSLLYSSFLDLSPSGQIKGDGRIDIKDLQFVFGRATSTCALPWPAQAPVNPKA
jgi:hypothetical protein